MAEFMAPLERLVPLLTRFVQLLKKERQALQMLDAAAILECASLKEALLEQIDPLAQSLHRQFPDDMTLRQWLQRHLNEIRQNGADSHTPSLINRFLDLSAEADTLNRHNGILIQHLLRNNQVFLQAIRGIQPPVAYSRPQSARTNRTPKPAAAPIARV